MTRSLSPPLRSGVKASTGKTLATGLEAISYPTTAEFKSLSHSSADWRQETSTLVSPQPQPALTLCLLTGTRLARHFWQRRDSPRRWCGGDDDGSSCRCSVGAAAAEPRQMLWRLTWLHRRPTSKHWLKWRNGVNVPHHTTCVSPFYYTYSPFPIELHHVTYSIFVLQCIAV